MGPFSLYNTLLNEKQFEGGFDKFNMKMSKDFYKDPETGEMKSYRKEVFDYISGPSSLGIVDYNTGALTPAPKTFEEFENIFYTTQNDSHFTIDDGPVFSLKSIPLNKKGEYKVNTTAYGFILNESGFITPTKDLEVSKNKYDLFHMFTQPAESSEFFDVGPAKVTINKKLFGNVEDEEFSDELSLMFPEFKFEALKNQTEYDNAWKKSKSSKSFYKEEGALYINVRPQAVKVTAPDGEHIVIEVNIQDNRMPLLKDIKKSKGFNINPMDGKERRSKESIEQSIEKTYLQSYTDLTSFLSNKLQDESILEGNLKKLTFNKQKSRIAYEKYRKFFTPIIAAVQEEYSRPDLFDPIKKGVIGVDKSGVERGEGVKNIYRTEIPFEKELKENYDFLVKKYVGPVSQEQLYDFTRKKLISDEIYKRKEAKIEEIQENIEDGEVPIGFEEYQDDPKMLTAILQLGTKEYVKEYVTKKNFLAIENNFQNNSKISKSYQSIKNKIEDPAFEFEVKEGENYYLINDKQIPEGVFNQYKKDLNAIIKSYEFSTRLTNDILDSYQDVEDTKLVLDLIGRDYNDWNKFKATTLISYANIFGGNLYALTESEEGVARYVRQRNEINRRLNKYARDVKFDDAFGKGWVQFGKFAAQELSNQLSVFTALAIPKVGLGILGASSFSENYGNMTLEELDSKGAIDNSTWKKIYTSAGYAIPEVAIEYFTTLPLIRGAKNSLNGMYGPQVRDYVRRGIDDVVTEDLPAFAKGAGLGISGEGLTMVLQNIVLGKPWDENVDHALFSGFMFETTLASVPLIKGVAIASLSDFDKTQEIRQDIETRNNLILENANLNAKYNDPAYQKNKKLKDLLQKREADNQIAIDELNKKIEDAIAEDTKSVRSMDKDAYEGYTIVTRQQEEIRVRAKAIIENKRIPDSQKKKMLEKLKIEFEFKQFARNEFKKEKHSKFHSWAGQNKNKKAFEELKRLAEQELRQGSFRVGSVIKEPTDYEIYRHAKTIWNSREINKNLNKAKKDGLLEEDLIVFQSVQEYEEKSKEKDKNGKLKYPELEKQLNKIKKGAHGFDSNATNKSYIVVENMAKDDRLEIKTHELSHRLLGNIISRNSDAFVPLSLTVLGWAEQNDTGLYNRLRRRSIGGADEVISVFLEEVAAGNVNLEQDNIGGIFGFMASNVVKENYDIDLNLGGQVDAITMLIGLGKKIKAGTLSIKDVEALKSRQDIKILKKLGETIDKIDTADKMSERSTVNLDEGQGDLSQKIDALTQGAKTKAEFQKPGGAFDNIYAGMIEGKFDKVFGKNISAEQKEIQRQNLADRLLGYDPAKTPELSKWLYGGSGKAGNVVYSGLVAKKKLFEKGQQRKRTRTIEDKDADIADVTTTTKETDIKDVKLRKLKDFNIELDNGLADALTIVEVNDILDNFNNGKITFEQAQKQLDAVVLKDIRASLSKIIPKISKGKPTPEYDAFIRNEYDEIIQSLGIKTIRTSYKKFFTQEKTGVQDYKNIDPITGKVSNYRKSTQINTTNKREFIRYFLEAKGGVLNERRTALIRRIAKRKASIAVDNYVEQNSDNLEAVVAAKIRSLSDSAENAINEQVSFDAVKFSEKVGANTNKINKQISAKGHYLFKGKKLFNKKTSQGFILEQAMAEAFFEISKNIKDFDVLLQVATEVGSVADAIVSYKGEIENHEIKKGLTAFMGSVLINNLNLKNKKFTLANEVHNDIKSRDGKTSLDAFITNTIVPNLIEKVKIYNEKIDAYNKKYGYKKGDAEYADQITGNVIKGKVEKMPIEVWNQVGKELGVLKTGIELIQNHYNSKKAGSVKSITLFGYGAFRLEESSIFKGLEMLDVNTEVYASLRYGKSMQQGSKRFVTFKTGMQFRLDKSVNKGKPKNEPNSGITTEQGIIQALGDTPALTKEVSKTRAINKAAIKARTNKYSESSRGITILDFDDTLATTESLVKYTAPDGTTGTLNAEEYALRYQDLLEKGYVFDFSEFNKVVKGKIAPLFQKALKLQNKFGPENMFVLTARPPQAQQAIFDFLKANGLNIPLNNITGLANSTSEAKALWIAEKVGEGYNDFYFADDALQNVQAVDNMLSQFDVKRKVQQAKVKFSDNLDSNFNDILETLTGIEAKKRFGATKARKRGASKGKFRFFIPPSHEDFVGLLYNFMGKGREGDAHRDFFEKSLIRPLNRAFKEYDIARQSIANDYKALNKQFPEVRKMFSKKTPDGDFTYQDAIRVYLFDKHGHTIPGLSPVDQTKLVELVKSDAKLQSYADAINVISKQDTYVDPIDGWESGDIRLDLEAATGRVGREQFFVEFQENADIIFSTENLNKIEAGYGKGLREAIEDMLYRIKTGKNRPRGQNKQVNQFMNWINGSVGTVMFFNMRSALLQQMSIVNYINFADNNILAAAKAFANQKQYWEDWAFIFNSDMLKQRRGGIQTDVNGAELAEVLRTSKNPWASITSKLLQLGFAPTQIADNIAIATGGATYYRNRINTYLKQGLSQKEAETKAFTDFQDITQSTQQSARPDMISQQQASVIGKIILNFQNVTSQFNRLGKKAFLDIKNRRITGPNKTQLQSDISNAARITYYFAIQNLIFYTLQTALFAVMFDDFEEEDGNKLFIKKRERLINGSIDSVLRGSGFAGAIVSTLKNVAIAYARQRDVDYNNDESAVLMEGLNLSPVVGIKARKIVNAEKTLNYNKKVIEVMDEFDLDNPQWSAYTNYVEAFTNLPLNRLYNKTQNMRQALNNDHANWERTLMFLGWSQYNLNIKNYEIEDARIEAKGFKNRAL